MIQSMQLNSIKQPIKKDLAQLNQLMKESLLGEHPKLNDIYSHILKETGKQIRAALIFLIGDTFPNKNKLQHLAVGIELIHLASLIHDDIIDQANLRRNQLTVHSKYGTENGIILGVHCYAIALKKFSILGTDVVQRISKTVQDLCEGEFLQVNERHNFQLSETDYWQIIQKKTATLFQASCELSAYLCDFPKSIQTQFGQFGNLLGEIFQLIDDYLDIYDTKNTLSKKIKQDLEMGDMSLPMILAKKIEPNKDLTATLIQHKTTISNQIKAIIDEKESKANSILKSIESVTSTQKIQDLLKIIISRVHR